MTEYEAYQEHIRYTHDTYCRIVIRHASFDAARMLAARWKRETSLEYLTGVPKCGHTPGKVAGQRATVKAEMNARP